MNKYDDGLERNQANFAQLSPLSFLQWAADVYPEHCAVIHGDLRLTWQQVRERSHRLGSLVAQRGLGAGDTVSAILSNTPHMIEAHHGVPMTGAILNAINTRLDAPTIAFILNHAESRLLLTDTEFSATVKEALAIMKAAGHRLPEVIDIDDPVHDGPGERLGSIEYEDLLASGDPHWKSGAPGDEWDAIGLNYTSGTTGNPKGVVVHHRGAYLNSMGNIAAWHMPRHPVYLWTLPMFHCNGWCFPWTVPAVAGTNVCLRKVDAELIFKLIREHYVTHYCGAPIVHSLLIDAAPELRKGIDWTVKAMVAGAAPPSSMIEGMDKLGFDVTHVYGLTEVYGPAGACAKQTDWEPLDLADRAQRNSRQGVRYQVQEALTVIDPQTNQPVPHDGETMGEVVFQGNITMKGYLKNPDATREAFRDGWFHTGDLGVVYPDGYVKLKDRAKDIIISGGENISSIEIEDALFAHPAVAGCAVVAKPDPKWGETPLAFIECQPGQQVTEEELIAHCRERLAGFKCPKEVRFAELPKTSTGKIQKHLLRDQIGSAQAIDGD